MSPKYREAPGVNFSTLKYINESPLAYREAVDNGVEDKPAWTLGRVAHTAFLEPYEWMSRYMIQPETVERVVGKKNPKIQLVKINSTSPEYKELLYKAAAAGRELIKQKEHDTAVTIARAATLTPRVSRLLRRKPRTEVPIFWERLGVKMKSQLDMLKPGEFIADLKSFGRSMRHIEREVFSPERNYVAQAAMYHDAWEFESGEDLPFIFIFVQSSPPFDVSVRQLTTEALQHGREIYTEWLLKLKECERLGEWPGTDGDDNDEPIILDLPTYLRPEDDIENEGYDWEESA